VPTLVGGEQTRRCPLDTHLTDCRSGRSETAVWRGEKRFFGSNAVVEAGDSRAGPIPDGRPVTAWRRLLRPPLQAWHRPFG
jgi:hypothetical protein